MQILSESQSYRNLRILTRTDFLVVGSHLHPSYIHGVKMIPISDFVAFEQIYSCRQDIFSVDLTVCMLQTC